MKRFPFTKKALLDLPPHDPDSPSREAEYTDSECVGLKLRVSKKGRKFFQHRYRHLGRKKCISLGEFPHISIPEARKRVSENIALLSRDIDPADERNHKKDDITLTTFAKDFTGQSQQYSKKINGNQFQEIYHFSSSQIHGQIGEISSIIETWLQKHSV
jgi:hypothetical protein